MRKGWIAAAVLGFALAYGLYWHWAAGMLQRNLAAWADQWRAQGYRIEYATTAVRGFPLTMRMNLDKLAIESPPAHRTWRWQPVTISPELSAEPWAPLSFSIALQGMHHLALIDGGARRQVDVYIDQGRGEVALSLAGRAKAVDFAAALTEIGDSDNMLRLEGLTGHVTLPPLETPDHARPSADFTLALDELVLPLVPGLPIGDRLQQIGLAGQVMGLIPVGPVSAALSRWRNDGGTIELTRMAGRWGAVSIDGSGTLALDGALQPLLAASVKLRGFGAAVDAAVAGGYLEPGQGTTAKLVLGAMAKPEDGAPTVTLPLTIQERRLSIGPLRLLRLPRLEWW